MWTFSNWKLFGIWDLDARIFPPWRDLVPALPGLGSLVFLFVMTKKRHFTFS